MAAETKTDVFQFMSLRSPQSLADKKLRASYIQDDDIGIEAGIGVRKSRSVFSSNSSSKVGKIIYEKVFLSLDNAPKETNQAVIQELLTLLVSKTIPFDSNEQADLVNELANSSYFRVDQTYYFLPVTLDSIFPDEDCRKIQTAIKLIRKNCESFNRKHLIKKLSELFDKTNLWDEVFYPKLMYLPEYSNIKNNLFDTLYLLYVMRRNVPVSLDNLMIGLGCLHVLEYLALDDFLFNIYTGKIDPDADLEIKSLLDFFKDIYPEIKEAKPSKTSSEHFYFIKDKVGLKNYFDASPLIHPIVAELGYFGKTKFNNIKPYLGDLKVVKQWLCGYKKGEISHIHNVMKGEEKERNYRYLEKSEDIFAYSSDTSQSVQTDTNTTDRFELKKESDKVIKTDVNVGVNANMTYKYGDIFTASLGANFSYANSVQDSQKTALNYARDIMNKAVTNIQSKSSQQRSITKIYESEEINNHKLINTQVSATHISGIYRWLDKKYKAQLYNFGQRWMFEFIIPEPAAFYVTSKLKAAEIELVGPVRPELPTFETVQLKNPKTNGVLKSEDIEEDVFDLLRLEYPLEEFTFPVLDRFTFFSTQDGKTVLEKNLGWDGDGKITVDRYTMQLDYKGYRVSGYNLSGSVKFYGANEVDPNHANVKGVIINGQQLMFGTDNSGVDNIKKLLIADSSLAASSYVDVTSGKIDVDLYFQDLEWYRATLRLWMKYDSEALKNWKLQVFSKIRTIEQAKVVKVNQELQFAYNAEMSEYHNKVNDLRSKVINDIIQGKSEAFNTQVILEELKKHCIAMIAKEFDFTIPDDDEISSSDSIGLDSVKVIYDVPTFKEIEQTVGIEPNTHKEIRATVGCGIVEETIKYPKINIEEANKKGRYIQFLEQAFEWQHLAYLFQPYFWAHESKWINLMNRLDYTDNNMTSFLKAGSTRVLIAVTPGYYNAVMHFLSTREPWDGGSAPVIGDPLFIPIYEEIHNRQDDMQNAIPEGGEWEFELPTSLVYLQDSATSIPTDLACD